MTNADKFKSLFGIYATELWSMPEKDFLKWLNSEVMNCSESPNGWIPCTSETMPERGIDVLTYVSTTDLIQVQTLDLYDDVLMWEEQSGYLQSFDTVAAWMPLPSAYKRGEQDE